MMLYNIGQTKLILQNTLHGGKQYVLKLPPNEIFMDHLVYNNLSDFGFYADNLNIECCSRFPYLTLDKKTKEVIINVLLCDPYYDTI